MKNIAKTLLKFYEEYKATDYLTEIDFVQQCIKSRKLSTEDDLVDYFLRFIQCEAFISKIAKRFITTQKLRKVNDNRVKVLIFYCIFILDCDNVKDIIEDPVYYTKPLLNFLSSEANYQFIVNCCSQYFDNEFIIHHVMEPLMNRANAFKTIEKYIHIEELKKLPHKHLTVPKEFKFGTKHYGSPYPPANTPKTPVVEPETPTVNYDKRSYLQLQQELRIKHKENVAKAQKLLQEAQNSKNARLSTVKTIKSVEPPPTEPKVRKNAPPMKQVEIRGNTTTTLREAYLLLKEHEEEINKLENIIKGGYNMQKIAEIEQEERKIAEKKAVESIQKKHLLGLITFEEAILAKKKLIDNNKQRSAEIIAERIELAEKLEEWRRIEQEKMKAKVEKSQQIKVDMKESEKRKLEKKQEEVRIQQHELREMLKKNEEEKAAELAKKIELIQEIKTIHEMNRKMNESRKDFDPTETANLGLLCEMSIAELHERLFIEKMNITKELEEKRNKIINKKLEQQKMIENYKEMITQMRKTPKCTIEPIVEISQKEEENPELTELKRILEEKRNLRNKVSL
ncbi:golgin subfamily A member 6-like protein 22 [Diorhabda carinulata]|uniref:golgin subfamily A member 6-like protein 22 n=1 Tax=Diorhabda carinulata TaxID=1163345 RepID=UPI0025A2F13E|nr:golgin subfamily A member 6-like protein 22 [Diorhabda carinulata]